jgi:protein-disulfide isomerase
MDANRFGQCMRSADVEQTIQRDVSIGRAAGVNATPTFFINKRRIGNASELDSGIQEALSTLSAVGRE